MLRGFTFILLLFAASASAALLFSYYDRDIEPPGPIEIAERVRTVACGGDVESFKELIDKDSVLFSLKRSELEKARKEHLFSTKKRPHVPSDLDEYILSTVPELLGVKLEIYENQVRAGESGPICNMEIVRAGDTESTVKLKFPGGERTTWSFGKVGEKWKIVSITDVRPLKLLSRADNRNLAAKRKNGPEHKKPEQKVRAEIKNVKSEGASDEVLTANIVRDQSADEHEVRLESRGDSTEQERIESSEKEGSSKSAETNELAAVNNANDFRTASWGMSEAQVKETEGEEPSGKSPGVLSFDTYFKGESVKVRYKFSGGGLKSGGIIFLNEHPEEIFYVQDYERRRGELTAKYGEPEIAEEIWYNRLYEGMPDKTGFAVAIGHLKLRTKWRTERSDVLLELKSKDYEMTLVLSYHSR